MHEGEPTSFADFLLFVVDATAEGVVGRPIRPRLKVTPQGLLRGEIDVMKIEVPALSVSGLLVDRFVIRAEKVRIVPGIPPHLRAGPVGFKAVLSQDNIDRWVRTTRLPVTLRLTDDGIIATAGFGGIRMSQMEVDLDVVGPLIRLRPVKANVLGMNAPLMRLARGYLPLPPLPAGARLERIEPGDGELAVFFRIEQVDEALTPNVLGRLRRRIGL